MAFLMTDMAAGSNAMRQLQENYTAASTGYDQQVMQNQLQSQQLNLQQQQMAVQQKQRETDALQQISQMAMKASPVGQATDSVQQLQQAFQQELAKANLFDQAGNPSQASKSRAEAALIQSRLLQSQKAQNSLASARGDKLAATLDDATLENLDGKISDLMDTDPDLSIELYQAKERFKGNPTGFEMYKKNIQARSTSFKQILANRQKELDREMRERAEKERERHNREQERLKVQQEANRRERHDDSKAQERQEKELRTYKLNWEKAGEALHKQYMKDYKNATTNEEREDLYNRFTEDLDILNQGRIAAAGTLPIGDFKLSTHRSGEAAKVQPSDKIYQVTDEASYNSVPSGATYVAPDGKKRVKQ